MWRWLAAALAAHVAVLLGLTFVAPSRFSLREVTRGATMGASGMGEERFVWFSVDRSDGERPPVAPGDSRIADVPGAASSPPQAPDAARKRVPAPFHSGRDDATLESAEEGTPPQATPRKSSSVGPRLAGLGKSPGQIPGTLGTTDRGIQLSIGLSDALAIVSKSPDQARPAAIQTHLDRALASQDLANGRGPGGAVAAAASRIAQEIGPNWGSVLLATVVDRDGRVIDVELLDAAGAGWARVPQALFRALRQLTLPIGRAMATRGVRIVTRVAAALRLPSGALAPVRVIPPGNATREYRDAPTRDASSQPPPQGLPMLGLEFDVADIGQPRRKVVSVQTVSVTPL